MTAFNNITGSNSQHAGGQHVPPIVPLTDEEKKRVKESGKDNEYLNTPDKDGVNPDNLSETDKEKLTSEEDFDKFDVDKVDDLQETKDKPEEEKKDN